MPSQSSCCVSPLSAQIFLVWVQGPEACRSFACSPDEEGQEALVDANAASTWRDTVKACQKYRDELTSVNYPAVDERAVEIFVFAGFVKPGRQVLIIYDPEDKEFYQRDIVVEVRSGDIYVEEARVSGNEKGRGNDEDLFERDDFIFKDWRRDTPENLR